MNFYSPTQGKCCNVRCTFESSAQECRPQGDCTLHSFCTGFSPDCPPSNPKPDGIPCDKNTSVCHAGVWSFLSFYMKIYSNRIFVCYILVMQWFNLWNRSNGGLPDYNGNEWRAMSASLQTTFRYLIFCLHFLQFFSNFSNLLLNSFVKNFVKKVL